MDLCEARAFCGAAIRVVDRPISRRRRDAHTRHLHSLIITHDLASLEIVARNHGRYKDFFAIRGARLVLPLRTSVCLPTHPFAHDDDLCDYYHDHDDDTALFVTRRFDTPLAVTRRGRNTRCALVVVVAAALIVAPIHVGIALSSSE